jgi:hypothetical protein
MDRFDAMPREHIANMTTSQVAFLSDGSAERTPRRAKNCRSTSERFSRLSTGPSDAVFGGQLNP